MMNIHLLLIGVQVFSSCFAGVYNEYLLKDTGELDQGVSEKEMQQVY